MKLLRLALALVITLSAMGCANSPKEAFALLSAQKQYESAEEAVSQVKPAAAIRLGEELASKIEPTDPAAKILGIPGNFKVFSFAVSEPAPTVLRLEALCSCLGDNKYLLIPHVLLATESGSAIEMRLMTRVFQDPAWTKPLRLVDTWALPRLQPGQYRLLVAADNSRNGEQITRSAGSGIMISGGIAIPVQSTWGTRGYPHGDITLTLR